MVREKRLSVLWTKHLNGTEKEDFEAAIRNSRTALNRLSQIIEELDTGLQTKALSLEDFDSASWAYKQAFLNGSKAAYANIKNILGDI